jgi:Xaa-Pro aminopeptidase
VEAFAASGCRGDDLIVAHGAQAADGHHEGSGRVANDDHLVCDLFPYDVESACFSDMTRTFSVGTPDPEIATWHEHTREALELSRELVRPGADGADVFREVCRLYEGHGYPTSLSKPEGTVLRDGFNHALGHGVGLDVHEGPRLSKQGEAALAAGMVVTVEPGVYVPGAVGVRIEDLVIVTDEGGEIVSSLPKDLQVIE